MGSLDLPQGTTTKRKIKIQDVTAYNPAQIETYFNDNIGVNGWRIIQILIIGTNKYIIAEKEYV